MNLNQWAIKWGIPYAAVEDLRREFMGVNIDPSERKEGESEAAVQNRIRLEASRKGKRLMRNNVGVLKDERGVPVRYGLCNDSKRLNEKCKSSDLIGIDPVLIQPYHVGTVIGQFVARECKESSWVYTGTPEEVAQLNFLQLIAAMGGNACFATSEGTL